MLGLLTGCEFRVLVAGIEEGRKVYPCSCLNSSPYVFHLLTSTLSNSPGQNFDPAKSSFPALGLPAARLPIGKVAGINNLRTFL
jgi:hypothetical protein